MTHKLIGVCTLLCLAFVANAQSPSNPTPQARKPAHNPANDAYKRAQMLGQPLPEKPKKPSKPNKPQTELKKTNG
jgi:hypothetical protein